MVVLLLVLLPIMATEIRQPNYLPVVGCFKFRLVTNYNYITQCILLFAHTLGFIHFRRMITVNVMTIRFLTASRNPLIPRVYNVKKSGKGCGNICGGEKAGAIASTNGDSTTLWFLRKTHFKATGC